LWATIGIKDCLWKWICVNLWNDHQHAYHVFGEILWMWWCQLLLLIVSMVLSW
jgi:hypothetical protein